MGARGAGALWLALAMGGCFLPEYAVDLDDLPDNGKECTSESDCDSGFGCNSNGKCREKCFEDWECGSFRFCDSLDHLCGAVTGEPCSWESGDYDCGTGMSCMTIDAQLDTVSGYCAPNYCSEDTACPPGYVCKAGVGNDCLRN